MLKPELQAKFLQHINRKKKGDEGFTLIELLVVVIIIGILAAIALPSLLGQVNKAKQAEAKQNVGAMNRAQQAFYLENQRWATTVTNLGVGIKSQTQNYNYTISYNTDVVQNIGQAQTTAKALKSYYGLDGTTIGDTTTSEALTIAVACESLLPTSTIDPVPTTITPATNGGCTSNYTSLAK